MSAKSLCPDEAAKKSKEKIKSMIGRNLLSLRGYTPDQIKDLLWSALDMKKVIKSGGKHSESLGKQLRGRSFAGIFQKKSTRTRFSFEAGAHHLGSHLIFCNKEDIHLGVNETVKDTALVMSRLCDGITARVYEHSLLEDMAKYSSVPIINALSDTHHPMQALADLMVIYEHFGRLQGLNMAWVGDGNNVLHSLMIVAAKLKMNLSIATPKGYEPSEEIVTLTRELSNQGCSHIFLTNSPKDAVKNAHIVVTDTWISMGQEGEKEKKLKEFEGYQVTKELMKEADPEWVFLHCLPRKQEEVDDEVFYDSERSLVFDEAENRKWTTMAVLANLTTGYTPRLIKKRPNF